ncbi:hypothetical protein YT14_004670 [Salmonella enterica subsp. enterica serovar Oslo]|nr:hypothetical protein [Salmonella enterica subsp. enterica serovar Oslo]
MDINATGTVSISGGNISAEKDVVLNASSNSLIRGSNVTATANITSNNGNIVLSGVSGNKNSGIYLINANLNALQGNIDITGTAGTGYGAAGIALMGGMSLTASTININGLTLGLDTVSGAFLPWGGVFLRDGTLLKPKMAI